MCRSESQRNAFTLIELVVVIIIIAILAAIAVPKFIDRADEAKESSTLQSLATLRSSIELYRADTGAYPATLATDIASYLKGPFPAARIGTLDSATVATTTDNPIATVSTGGEGWIYNSATGDVRINHAAHIAK